MHGDNSQNLGHGMEQAFGYSGEASVRARQCARVAGAISLPQARLNSERFGRLPVGRWL